MPVSVSSLKTITGYNGTDTDLQIYADTADIIIDDITQTSSLFASQSQALRDTIALYVAAHYYVISEERGGLLSQTIGESKDRYNTPSSDKTGLYSTRFGQQACALDTTGVLSNLSNQFKVSVDVKVI